MGTFADRPRSGRPRVTSVRQDNSIRQRHLSDRFVTAESTSRVVVGNRGRPISRYTVRRQLRKRGITCRRPYCGLVLTLSHRHQHLIWACNHRGQRWQNVVFSHESRFNLWNADGRIRVYRQHHERYVDNCVVENNPYGGGGVMVWAVINYRFKTQLVVCQGNLTARRYIDQVLCPVVVQMFRQRQNLVYQHNNTRPHIACATLDFLQANNIGVLPWPACSPDCNPIEHVWDYLGRRQPQTANVQQLMAALHQEWGRIPRYLLRNLCGSMRRRVAAVVASRGGHTRY